MQRNGQFLSHVLSASCPRVAGAPTLGGAGTESSCPCGRFCWTDDTQMSLSLLAASGGGRRADVFGRTLHSMLFSEQKVSTIKTGFLAVISLGIYPKEVENHRPHKNPHADAYTSFIQDGQNSRQPRPPSAGDVSELARPDGRASFSSSGK